MTAPRTRSQVSLEHMQIAHKIAELNKAYGAIPRGAQGSSSIGREIARLLKRQSDLRAELESHPKEDPAGS